MNAPRTEWFSPQTILALVGMAAAFVAFCISFDRRITTVEMVSKQIVEAQRDHKADEETRLYRMEQKLDDLLKESRK